MSSNTQNSAIFLPHSAFCEMKEVKDFCGFITASQRCLNPKCASWQWPARVSILENSRFFFWKFTSRSRFWVIWFSLSLLEKSEGRKFFTFHFSKMVKSFHISLFLLRKMSGIECNSSWIDWEFFLHQQLNSSILIFGSFKIQQRTIQKSVFFWTLLSQIMNLISKLLVKSRLLSAKRAEATEFTTRCMCWKEAVTKNSNFATLVYCQ